MPTHTLLLRMQFSIAARVFHWVTIKCQSPQVKTQLDKWQLLKKWKVYKTFFLFVCFFFKVEYGIWAEDEHLVSQDRSFKNNQK